MSGIMSTTMAILAMKVEGADAAVAEFGKVAAASKAASAEISASSQAGFAAAASSVGKYGAALGAVDVAVMAFTGTSSARFKDTMEMVRTEAQGSQQEVDKMSAAILKLSTSSVGIGPEKLAEGLYHIESAGFRGSAALNMLKASAEGARVGHAGLEEVSNALVGTIASNIKGYRDASDAMAQLNAIVGSGNMRMSDLAAAIGTGVLPAFKNAGLSLRDFGAAEATLTDNAVPANEAATRLRMTVALMEAPTRKAEAALASIGITSTQLGQDMRQPNGLLVAVMDLKTHLEHAGLSATQQAQVIEHAFGGGRTSSAIQTLIGEADRLKSKYDEQAQAAAKWGEDVKAAEGTAAAAVDRAKATFEAASIILGNTFAPSIGSVANELQVATKDVAGFASEHQKLVGAIGTGGLIIGGLALGLWAIEKALKAVEAATVAVRAIMGAGWVLDVARSMLGLEAATAATAVSEVAVGAQAAAASVEVAGLGTMVERTSGLLVPYQASLSAAAVEETAVGTAAEAATISVAALAAGLGIVLVGIVGIVKGWQQHNDAIASAKKQVDDVSAAIARGDTTLAGYRDRLVALGPAAAGLSSATSEVIAKADAHTAALKKTADQAVASTMRFGDLSIGLKATGDAAQTMASKIDPPSVDALNKLAAQATKSRDALAAALYSGDTAALPALTKAAISDANAAQRWADARTAADKLVAGSSTNSTNEILANLKRLESEGWASQMDNVTAMSTAVIGQMERMKRGVIDAIAAMKTELAKPITAPQLVMPGAQSPTSIPTAGGGVPYGGPSPTSTPLMPPDAISAMAAFNDAVSKLPANLQGAMSKFTDDFTAKVTALHNTEIAKLETENRRHEDRLTAIHKTLEDGIAKAQSAANAQLKTLHDSYLSALGSLNTAHAGKLDSILQSFNTSFQTTLTSYQTGIATLQGQAAQAMQTHNDALRKIEDDANTKLQAVHGKNQEQQRANIEAAAARADALEITHYNNTINGIDLHATALTSAFNGHVAGVKTTLDTATANENKGYQGHATLLGTKLEQHARDVQSKLDAHIAGLQKAFNDDIRAETTKNEDDVRAIEKVFGDAVHKLTSGLSAMTTGAGMFDAVKTAADNLANTSLKALALSILETTAGFASFNVTLANGSRDYLTTLRGTGLSLADLRAKAIEAATASKQIADAMARAALIVAKAAGDWAAVMAGEAKTAADALSRAQAKLAYDIEHHTGSIIADIAAINAATAAQKSNTAAVAAGTLAVTAYNSAAHTVTQTLGSGLLNSFGIFDTALKVGSKSIAETFANLDTSVKISAKTVESSAVEQSAAATAWTKTLSDAGAKVTEDEALVAQKTYDLANGISDNLPPLADLKNQLADATLALNGYQAAVTQATAGQMSLYDSQVAAAKAASDKATADYLNAKAAGVSGSALDFLYTNAVNAGVVLAKFQDWGNDIQTAVNKIVKAADPAAASLGGVASCGKGAATSLCDQFTYGATGGVTVGAGGVNVPGVTGSGYPGGIAAVNVGNYNQPGYNVTLPDGSQQYFEPGQPLPASYKGMPGSGGAPFAPPPSGPPPGYGQMDQYQGFYTPTGYFPLASRAMASQAGMGGPFPYPGYSTSGGAQYGTATTGTGAPVPTDAGIATAAAGTGYVYIQNVNGTVTRVSAPPTTMPGLANPNLPADTIYIRNVDGTVMAVPALPPGAVPAAIPGVMNLAPGGADFSGLGSTYGGLSPQAMAYAALPPGQRALFDAMMAAGGPAGSAAYLGPKIPGPSSNVGSLGGSLPGTGPPSSTGGVIGTNSGDPALAILQQLLAVAQQQLATEKQQEISMRDNLPLLAMLGLLVAQGKRMGGRNLIGTMPFLGYVNTYGGAPSPLSNP